MLYSTFSRALLFMFNPLHHHPVSSISSRVNPRWTTTFLMVHSVEWLLNQNRSPPSLCISTNKADYDQMNITYCHIKPTPITAITDTEALSCRSWAWNHSGSVDFEWTILYLLREKCMPPTTKASKFLVQFLCDCLVATKTVPGQIQLKCHRLDWLVLPSIDLTFPTIGAVSQPRLITHLSLALSQSRNRALFVLVHHGNHHHPGLPDCHLNREKRTLQ